MIFSRGINFGTDVLSSCNLEIKLHTHVWELRSLNLCKDRIDRKEFCLANFLSLPTPHLFLSLDESECGQQSSQLGCLALKGMGADCRADEDTPPLDSTSCFVLSDNSSKSSKF